MEISLELVFDLLGITFYDPTLLKFGKSVTRYLDLINAFKVVDTNVKVGCMAYEHIIKTIIL